MNAGLNGNSQAAGARGVDLKAFSLTTDQIASIAASLAVDELAARFDRHVDTLKAATWSAETPLLEGGADLSVEEAAACRARLFQFFGGAAPPAIDAKAFGDWAAEVVARISERLTAFSFHAAGDGGSEAKHAADVIFADAASAANLLYGRRRILSLVAPHGLIGFVLSILTPNLLEAPAIDVRKTTPDELKKSLAFGDALVATPSLWRYVMAQGVFAPDNSMAVFFGEPMTPDLSAEIRKAGFGAQREIYGSTEDGLIGWRDSPSDPFALFDQWRRSGDGVVRILPAGGAVEKTPMDILVWEGERRFRLGGRRDGAVQIGAVNVFPARIAQKIAEHPEIAECRVAVSRHAGGADRLVATIALKRAGPPPESVARSIDNWCRQKLRAYERPRVYNFAESVEP
jgi:4-coumarate--CoA ligase (photoactive yellow protein activation family)